MRKSILAVFAAAVFGVAIVDAQDRLRIDASGVSLDQAIATALERAPDLRAVRTDVDAARGALVQAGLKPNPMVSMSRQQQPGGSDNQTSVSVEWPLDLFRKTGRVAVAEIEVDASRLRAADREREMAADVRTAYGAAAAAIRDLEVTDGVLAAASRQEQQLTTRVEQGAAPPIQRDLLTVERRRMEADRLLQAARADVAMIAVKRLMGMPSGEPLGLREGLESLVEGAGPSPAAAIEQIISERPDVKGAEANRRIADAEIMRARQEGRFDVSLFGSYIRMNTRFPQLAFNQAGGLQPIQDVFHYAAGGATVTIPLRNDNRGAIASAEARRAGAAARRESAELQARSEVAAASALNDAARAAVSAYAEVRILARRNVDTISQTYELGRGTITDVLAEQRHQLEVERAYTEVLKQAYDARTALLRAMGARR